VASANKVPRVGFSANEGQSQPAVASPVSLVQYGNEIIRQIRLTRIGDKAGRELLWGLGRVARLNDVVASQF